MCSEPLGLWGADSPTPMTTARPSARWHRWATGGTGGTRILIFPPAPSVWVTGSRADDRNLRAALAGRAEARSRGDRLGG